MDLEKILKDVKKHIGRSHSLFEFDDIQICEFVKEDAVSLVLLNKGQPVAYLSPKTYFELLRLEEYHD